ncbi:hypothetical protein [Nocardia seriolae]|uniref:Uncharacterized protein n=2 Tax=Nocardia seriolae TaxID=37332 RepID=A0ABC9Z2X3_9NOCA|nr:hypothetical protein [Nocardia seriolae]APB01002.1 hypothetical protein NS506_06974 [Nocardia seriolae]MTJ65538.1 hypothetical protein [Nocardia seriolae]MTJ75096.1 hypothetical protein [Nocardia seriolae]MTJ90416.1 hypothetical protein [Nocardia seriolae]MTK34377.1 hypothetical protein [Nocardia seriolae]
MVRTAAAAADPDEPDIPATASRPKLEVVPESPDPEAPQPHSFGAHVLSAADIERLPSSARRRIAAFIHLQVATLEEWPEPVLPPIPELDEI